MSYINLNFVLAKRNYINYEDKKVSSPAARSENQTQSSQFSHDAKVNKTLAGNIPPFHWGSEDDADTQSVSNTKVGSEAYQCLSSIAGIKSWYMSKLQNSLNNYREYKKDLAYDQSVLNGETEVALLPDTVEYYQKAIADTQDKLNNLICNKSEDNARAAKFDLATVVQLTRIAICVLSNNSPDLAEKCGDFLSAKEDNQGYFFDTTPENFEEKMTNAINIIKNEIQSLKGVWNDYYQNNRLDDFSPKELLGLNNSYTNPNSDIFYSRLRNLNEPFDKRV